MPADTRRALLAIGDVAALVVFTIIGLVNHADRVTLPGIGEVVIPIVLVGALAARAFETYARPGIRTLLPAWLVAVPAGLAIRKALFHTPATWGAFGVFLAVALAFTLLFLLLWRAAASLLLRPA